MWVPFQSNITKNMRSGIYEWIEMRRSNIRHALEMSEYPTAIARGGTEFQSQVFLGASVHAGIYSLP